jgi:RNA polymerase sigma factor (sigma-70 family)
MTVEAIRGVVGGLRRAAAAQAASGLTDGALLDRFIGQRDPAAFADLVRRHGPMVLGVCRRILGNRPDVDDAFQAIFLVLVQKAPTIVPQDMVGNWLHGVAYRTAVRVRAGNRLRQHREKPMGTVPEPAAAEQPWDDLRPLLDEELGRLPSRYRAVLVLCDMEGRTRKDAARHLRCPEGTVSTWLTRGRAILAQRLTRRGVALGGGTLATLLADHATACVPPTLVDSTTRCASGAIPRSVSVIANGTMGAMAMYKTVVFAGWAVAAILGSGVCGVVACYLQAGPGPGTVESKAPPAKVPAHARGPGPPARR